MRVLEDTKMAGLCNRSQWYLQAAALLVAFYLTHDDSTRLHSRGILSLSRTRALAHAYTRISNIPRTRMQRATVVADVGASYTFTWVARTTITDASPRRAVKASQSSFHRCSLHGRVGNIRGDSKGNQIRGKANERPGHARHIHNIGAYVHT